MTKTEVVRNIMNSIDEIKDKYDYDFIGVRVQENEFVQGEILDYSYIWVDGECTSEELDGTCAIRLEDAELANGYYGQHIAIIAGNYGEYGQDLGEIIIRDAEVLEVLS
ncbi:MAG: hypothetical protein Q4D16_19505 [Eubacteriales bacterium]|nr:hypothetical protein [Eubacteriales bacterium]